VSPGAPAGGAVAEARCPTFSWAGAPWARGYELAVLRVAEARGAEPELVLRASLPADARSYTPPVDRCLERGASYAWSVAAAASDAGLDWAPPYSFAIAAAPSIDELEQAVATVLRYRDSLGGSLDDSLDPGPMSVGSGTRPAGSAGAAPPPPGSADPLEPERVEERSLRRPLRAALAGPSSGIVRVAAAASAPVLGTPSLRVSANLALGAASNVFKDDAVFLWDDDAGNTALGREALSAVSADATHNTALGRGALASATAIDGGYEWYGSYNTALGYRALTKSTTGYRNTAVGAYALYENQTGLGNTATGYDALRSNTTGGHNTATGFDALRSNTTGTFNTAGGFNAMRDNTSGTLNTAIGYNALLQNESGFRNTAVGVAALRESETGQDNTAIGAYALSQNTSGANTAMGAHALRNNLTGHFNTAVGDRSMFASTAGKYNTAIGHAALEDNTLGDGNAAAGVFALANNTTGEGNAALGMRALRGNTTGIGNTGVGSYSLNNNQTGSRNAALGYRAGILHVNGDDNILVHSFGLNTESNVLRIGADTGEDDFELAKAFIQGIDGVTTGVNDAVPVVVDSAGQLGTVSSSRRLKQDIQDLGPAAERLLDLRPVAFRYKQHAANDRETPLQYGLIAEEVAEVFPELVVYDREGTPATVRYHLLSSLLLSELQRLHARVAELEERSLIGGRCEGE
jgi:hypothetical protein